MNKQKGIIIGVLALVVTMMVGYAIFSETIKINGTATAKGSFDITATCTPGLTNADFISANLFEGVFGYALKNDNNYKEDSFCTVNGNEITYSAELKQPGAVRNFTIKMTNSGTIDAVLDLGSGITSTAESCIGNYDTGEFSDCQSVINNASSLMNEMIITGFEKSDGTVVLATESNTNELLNFLDENQENIILKPGESVYFVFGTEWGDLGPKVESSQKVLYKEIVKAQFAFKQPTN